MFKLKRGQLTLFVIVAVVLVIAIILYFYYVNGGISNQKYDPKVEILRQNILDCFEKDYEQSLSIVGIQGGYLNTPEPKSEVPVYYFSFSVPYYYYEGKLNIPEIEKIQNEISELSESSIRACFEEYKLNESYDFIEFSENPSVDVKINEDQVIFTANIIMNVGYDNKTASVDLAKTPVNINSDIYNMHQTAKFIAEHLKDNNEWTPFSDIVELSNQYDLYVNIVDSEDGSENYVEINSRKEGYYPSAYKFNNKLSNNNLGEIGPLL